MTGQNPQTPSTPVPVSVQTGRFFRFALPAGWLANENSNLLCLNSPDNAAAIMHVGLVGMLQPFTPDQFVHYALHMHQMIDVRFLSGQPVTPAPGCTSAGVFELTYSCNRIACQGIVTANVALGYGQCNASMTLAAAQTPVWHQYRSWLPQVAAQAGPAGMQAYMAGQVAADNLRQSIELGRHAREVNDYIAQLQQQTTNERWASQDRNNFHFRENLGNVGTYHHPYESRTIELPTTYRYYWMNRAGQVYGTDNPTDDPRIGSTEEWTQMNQYRPQ